MQVYSTSTTPPVTASMVTSSPTVSTTYTYHPATREEHKRRFTEEKVEDKVPENLLGYEVSFSNHWYCSKLCSAVSTPLFVYLTVGAVHFKNRLFFNLILFQNVLD